MMSSEDMRWVRQEVKRQLNVILSGAASDNDAVETETINSLYPGSPPIPARPVMHPYGFASRAPAGTIQVTAKQGADAQNRMVLGHRDTMRKQLSLEEGDSVIYASDGDTVLATIKLNANIAMETEASFSCKNQTGELVAAIVQLFTDIQSGLTTTILGPQPLVMPTFVDDFAVLQSFQEAP